MENIGSAWASAASPSPPVVDHSAHSHPLPGSAWNVPGPQWQSPAPPPGWGAPPPGWGHSWPTFGGSPGHPDVAHAWHGWQGQTWHGQPGAAMPPLGVPPLGAPPGAPTVISGTGSAVPLPPGVSPQGRPPPAPPAPGAPPPGLLGGPPGFPSAPGQSMPQVGPPAMAYSMSAPLPHRPPQHNIPHPFYSQFHQPPGSVMPLPPQGVWERPRSRSRSRSSRGEKFNKLVRRMKTSLKDGDLEQCTSVAFEILDLDNKKPPIDLLRSMLESAAAKPRPDIFGKALQCCALGKITLEPVEYARLLGILMSRNASLAQCRLVLNMALQRNASLIPLVPEKSTDEEKEDAFKDAEVAPAARSTATGDDDKEEQEDELQESDGEETEFEQAHDVLELHDCIGIPELNGKYTKEPPMLDVLDHDRPIYVKAQEDSDVGTDFATVFVYFSSYLYTPWRTGWYISSDIPEGKIFAYHPADTLFPPRRGWQVLLGEEHRRQDSAVFRMATDKEATTAVTEVKEEVCEAGEAQQALSKVHRSKLPGCVNHKGKPEVAKYFSHFTVLLHLERLAEMGRIRRRLLRQPLEKLLKFGWALEGLRVCGIFGQRSNQKAALEGWKDTGSEFVAFWIPRHTDFDRLRIKQGETIVLSKTDPLRDRIGEGVVESITWDRIVVRLSGTVPDGGRKQDYRMDAYANKVVYERQFNALLKIVKKEKLDPLLEMLVSGEVGNVDSWAKQWSRKETLPPWRQNPKDDVDQKKENKSSDAAGAERNGKQKTEASRSMSGGSNAKNSTSKESRAAALAKEDPRSPAGSPAAASRREKVAEEVAKITNINNSQKAAVTEAAIRRCTIIQGPPGTGKTHVAVNLLLMWAKTLGLRPLLATSDSNVAVDNIAEGLNRAGVSAVRLGRPEKVREHLEDIALDNILRRRKEEKAAKKASIEAEKNDAANASEVGDEETETKETKIAEGEIDQGKNHTTRKEEEQGSDVGEDEKMQTAHTARQKERQEDYAERKKILKEADVICCTTISSGGDILREFKFQAILVDEVAQATETSVIVPIVFRGTTQLVLCGDQCQLPPTVQSREAEIRGLSLSLYSRLAESGVDQHFLDTQYRSHPRLAEFSSRCFYKGALRSGVPGSQRPPPGGIDWPNPEVPVAFFEVGAEEVLEGESKANKEEVKCVLDLVLKVLNEGALGPEEIGVVTPYMAQVRALRRAIRERVSERTRKLIEIASVDNFQGREKDLIIFSAVRSNQRGNVGFLGDWRRLNVMLTRARRGLVIFGSAATLRHDCYWQQWLEWCQDLRGISKAPDPTTYNSNARKRKNWNQGRAADLNDDVVAPWQTERNPKVLAGPKPPPRPPPAFIRPPQLSSKARPSAKPNSKASAKPSGKARPSAKPSARPLAWPTDTWEEPDISWEEPLDFEQEEVPWREGQDELELSGEEENAQSQSPPRFPAARPVFRATSLIMNNRVEDEFRFYEEADGQEQAYEEEGSIENEEQGDDLQRDDEKGSQEAEEQDEYEEEERISPERPEANLWDLLLPSTADSSPKHSAASAKRPSAKGRPQSNAKSPPTSAKAPFNILAPTSKASSYVVPWRATTSTSAKTVRNGGASRPANKGAGKGKSKGRKRR